MAQQLINPTSSHEDMVRSLASLSGLGIWHCHELWCQSQRLWLCHQPTAGSYSSDWTPSLRPSIYCRCGPKKKVGGAEGNGYSNKSQDTGEQGFI